MRIFATVFVILVSTFIVNASILDPVIQNVVHLQATKPPGDVPGIWKKKTIWKPRWVKEWKSAKVMKPVWRKVWSPVQIREWVPIPKPPPGWSSASTPLAPIKTTPKENHAPLWDPVSYPESQQPPPPPPSPQYHHQPQPDVGCGPGGCDAHTSQTFNHHQITEIIGSERYNKGLDHHESGEFSESVAHLTSLQPNWEQPQQPPSFDVQIADGFADFSELSQFLIPPRFQNALNYNQKESEFHHHHHHHDHHDHHHHEPTGNVQITHSPGFEVNHIVPLRWTPLHPIDNKDEKRFTAVKTSDQPYKFQIPENYVRNLTSHQNLRATKPPASGPDGDLSAKPNFQTHKINKLRTERDPSLIESSQLVGEYHYSESSLTGDVKPEPGKPHHRPEIKEQTRTRPKQAEESGIKPGYKPDFRPPLIETKQRPIKKENKKVQQRPTPVQNGPPHHQNHHSTSSQHDFEQTKADIQEIAPNFVVATPPMPSNHKPSPNTTERKVFTPPPTTVPPPHSRAPVTSAPDYNSLVPTLETHSEKNFIVQVVYPTPQHHQKIPPFRSLPEGVPSETFNKRNPNSTRSREETSTSETATLRSEVIPTSSSSPSSTTTSKPDTFTTDSSVFVVTPIYPEKS